MTRQGGGPAATAAVTLARLGASASLAGAIGDDALGREQLEELAREGVDVANVEAIPGKPSFLCLILVDEATGDRTIFSAPAERPFAVGRTDALATPPDLVLVDGWGGGAQKDVALRARARGIPVLLDAGSVRPDVLALLDAADVIIASEPFAAEWVGGPRAGPAQRASDGSAAAAVRKLIAAGATLAAVTRGPLGAVCGARGSDELFQVPAVAVKPVDTTGAGDAFHGAAALGLAAGRTWEEALRFAAWVAARKCERMGARAGLPFLAEAKAAGWA